MSDVPKRKSSSRREKILARAKESLRTGENGTILALKPKLELDDDIASLLASDSNSSTLPANEKASVAKTKGEDTKSTEKEINLLYSHVNNISYNL